MEVVRHGRVDLTPLLTHIALDDIGKRTICLASGWTV